MLRKRSKFHKNNDASDPRRRSTPNRDKPLLHEAFAFVKTAGIQWGHVFVLKETALWFLSGIERCVDEFFVSSGFAINGTYHATKFEKLRTVASIVKESYVQTAL